MRGPGGVCVAIHVVETIISYSAIFRVKRDSTGNWIAYLLFDAAAKSQGPYLLVTSTVWRQDHNGSTHQNPGFLDVVVNKSAAVARIYLPPDVAAWKWPY